MYLVQKTKLRRQILHTSTLCTYVFLFKVVCKMPRGLGVGIVPQIDMQDYQVSGLQKGE